MVARSGQFGAGVSPVFAMVLLIALASPATLAQAQASTAAELPQPVDSTLPARLSDVEGPVQIQQQPIAPGNSAPDTAPNVAPGQVPAPPPENATTPAEVNMPVLAGMQIDTGNDGRAELQFSDGSIARLSPNSALAVTSIAGTGEILRAVRGLTYYELPDQTTGVLTVQTGPDQVRLATGTLLRVNLDNAPYQIAVLRGSVHVNSPASDIGFEAISGETATVDPFSPAAYDLQQEIAAESWDAWNTDRDNVLAELAQGETNARAGSGSPDAQSWNDLDYYGSWYNVPGQGMAWAPYGVDASFDPYGAGSWGYYPGVGPTWISAYPWGWLPYHCGGWNYFDGFGWSWLPGGCGSFGTTIWYPYTGVHSAPRNYRSPKPPYTPPFHVPRRLTGGVPVTQVAAAPGAGSYSFRQLGSPRPQPRSFPLLHTQNSDGEVAFAPVVPVLSTPAYGGTAGSAFAGGSGVQPRGTYTGTSAYSRPGSSTIAPLPRIVPQQGSTIAPLPRVIAPAPRIAAPPMPAAPHYSAPAAAPVGRH